MALPEPKVLRLKYQLGELVLGTWRPCLHVLAQPLRDASDWPPDPMQLMSLLSPGAAGALCRGVGAGQFGPGIGQYGDFLRYLTHNDVVYSVSLQGSFQEYLRKFSAKSRQNLTRSVRRYGERQNGQPVWQVYTAPDQMPMFHAEALAISQQTYQTQLLDAGLSSGPDFVQNMCALAARGQARGYLLRDGSQAIAFAWCRGDGDQLIYDVIGYVPSAAALSPGTILLFHILEDLFSLARFTSINFGGGEAQYKAMFATDKQDMADVYLFLPSLRNRALLHLHWFVFRISAALGAWLERAGLKQRVKKILRGLKRH